MGLTQEGVAASPDLGNQRWYRRLDEDGTFRYRDENLTTGVAGLFGTVADSNPPAQIVTDQVSVQVNTSDSAHITNRS